MFPELPIQGRGASHIVLDVGDMDGDGDLDAVTSHGGASTSDIAVYRNNGTGTYAQSHRIAGNYAFAKFAELSGDGIPDLLFVSAPTAPPYDFFTARGNGNGTFQAPVRHPLNLCGIAHPSAFDVDNDGDLDVINTENAGCFGGGVGNTIRISLNNGNGTFAPQMVFVVGIWPYHVNAGDFDEDGNLDLVTASQGVSGVVFGNGDGTFQQPGITLPSGELSANVLVLDLDADTHLDVVALRDYSPSGSAGNESELVVLFGDGAGAFTPVAYPQFLTQDFREWLASGDVDADGDQDILAGGVNDTLVFLNDGAGALTYSGRYGIGASAFSMHYADLTGDGTGDWWPCARTSCPRTAASTASSSSKASARRTPARRSAPATARAPPARAATAASPAMVARTRCTPVAHSSQPSGSPRSRTTRSCWRDRACRTARASTSRAAARSQAARASRSATACAAWADRSCAWARS